MNKRKPFEAVTKLHDKMIDYMDMTVVDAKYQIEDPFLTMVDTELTLKDEKTGKTCYLMLQQVDCAYYLYITDRSVMDDFMSDEPDEEDEDAKIDFINEDTPVFDDYDDMHDKAKDKSYYRPLTLLMYLNDLDPEEFKEYVKTIVNRRLSELQYPILTEDDR